MIIEIYFGKLEKYDIISFFDYIIFYKERLPTTHTKKIETFLKCF